MEKANYDVRTAIDQSGLKYWVVADRYGCTDSTFSKKLRRELPPTEKERLFKIIDELSREVG